MEVISRVMTVGAAGLRRMSLVGLEGDLSSLELDPEPDA